MVKLKKRLKDSVTLLKFSGCANLQVTIHETNQKESLASRTAIPHVKEFVVYQKLSYNMQSSCRLRKNLRTNSEDRDFSRAFECNITNFISLITPTLKTTMHREIPPLKHEQHCAARHEGILH